MSAKTIRTALGLLQDDPDNEQAWSDLRSSLGVSGRAEKSPSNSEMSREDLSKLVSSARRAHEMRREYDEVARLLEMEVVLAKGNANEGDLLQELARVLDEELMDDARAVLAFEQYLKLVPGDTKAEEAVERSDARRSKWSELVKRYVEEAKKAGEGSFRSSLLVSAAETAYRYGRPALEGEKGKKKQLAALQPKVIVALGKFAAQWLTGKPDAAISALRGKWHRYQGIPVMPTYHPAYLLRTPSAKRVVWEDLQQVMAELHGKVGAHAPASD